MVKIEYFPHDVDVRNAPKLVLLKYELSRDAVVFIGI